jgi:RNA polymerase sporulation-specific sigma factor
VGILVWALAITAVINGSLALFAYINNQVFPQPLEEEDEKNILRK